MSLNRINFNKVAQPVLSSPVLSKPVLAPQTFKSTISSFSQSSVKRISCREKVKEKLKNFCRWIVSFLTCAFCKKRVDESKRSSTDTIIAEERPNSSTSQKIDNLTALSKRDFRAFSEQFFTLDHQELNLLSQNFIRDPYFASFVKSAVFLQNCPRSTMNRHVLVNFLSVIFGIKPVLFENESQFNDAAKKQISLILSLDPKCKAQKDDRGNYYFVNEKPLSFFDPKKFIQNFESRFSSFLEAAKMGFSTGGNASIKDQVLSYVLGFGPTWEAFAIGQKYASNYKAGGNGELIFTDEHYRQLGKAINASQNGTRTDYVALGKEYSRSFGEKMVSNTGRTFDFDSLFTELEMGVKVDDIAFQTEYVQKVIACRKQLLAFIALLNQNFGKYN